MSSHIEIEGNLPEDPALAYSEAGTPWTRFKVIVNDRIKQQDDTYTNGPAITYWVKAFRNLAENVANSLAKGDPILVTGELTISEYLDNDGVVRTAQEIMARRAAVPPDAPSSPFGPENHTSIGVQVHPLNTKTRVLASRVGRIETATRRSSKKLVVSSGCAFDATRDSNWMRQTEFFSANANSPNCSSGRIDPAGLRPPPGGFHEAALEEQ